MRQVTLQGAPFGSVQEQISWLHRAAKELETASRENDPVVIAQNYTIVGAFTETRTLTVATATLANLIAFVATLVTDLQKGGANRTN